LESYPNIGLPLLEEEPQLPKGMYEVQECWLEQNSVCINKPFSFEEVLKPLDKIAPEIRKRTLLHNSPTAVSSKRKKKNSTYDRLWDVSKENQDRKRSQANQHTVTRCTRQRVSNLMKTQMLARDFH